MLFVAGLPGLARAGAPAHSSKMSHFPKIQCHVETPCEMDCDIRWSRYWDGISHWIVCVEACGVNWDHLMEMNGRMDPAHLIDEVQAACDSYCDEKYGTGQDFTAACYWGCGRWATRCRAVTGN